MRHQAMEIAGERHPVNASSSAKSDDSLLEVSVVASPEVFGVEHQSEASVEDKSCGSPEIEEQTTERCPTSTSDRSDIKRTAENDLNDTHSPQLHRASLSSSAFSEARPSPNGNHIHTALLQWQWVSIDGVQLPVVLRNGERYLAVHMVQLKLLSKFPSVVPSDILARYTMISHRMTVTEAWVFNSVNAVLRKFDLGCQIFTSLDEVVLLQDVQCFYWNVKAYNLNRILQQYETEMHSANSNVTLVSVITALKSEVNNDLEGVRGDLRRLSEPAQLANTLNNTSNNVCSPRLLNGHAHSPSNRTSNQSPHSTVSDSKTDVNVYS